MSDVFDLNAVRKEAKSTREPFAVKIGTRKFSLVNPIDGDWRDFSGAQKAALAGDPEPMLRLLLVDDFDRFNEERVSLSELSLIVQAATEYYGAPLPK